MCMRRSKFSGGEPVHSQMPVCPYRAQAREHLFKCCPHWKRQQIILWAEVQRETGLFKIRDLLADTRRSQAVPHILSAADVGRRAPVPVEEGVQSDASNVNSGRSSIGSRPRRWPPRVRDSHCSFPHPPSRPLRERSKASRGQVAFLLAFPFSFPLLFLWRSTTFWAGTRRRVKGNLQRAAIAWTADGNRSKCAPP